MELTLQRVLKQQEGRQKIEKQTYQKILESVNKKIEYQSNQKHTFCLYDVPNFIVGLPSFNRDKAYEYIVNALLEIGYFVQSAINYTIFISWERTHLERHSKVVLNSEKEAKKRQRDLKKLRESSRELMHSLENKDKKLYEGETSSSIAENFRRDTLPLLQQKARQINTNNILNSNKRWH